VRYAAVFLLACLPTLARGADLLFTGETSFQPLPCDCPVESLGGWSQRARLLDSLRTDAGPPILDTGGWLAGGIAPRTAQLTAEAMRLLSYDVINVGSADLAALEALEPGDWRTLPLVCGIPPRGSGIPRFREIRRGGETLLVIGAGWFGPGAASPAEQVHDVLARAAAADAVVVLCAGGLGPARTIAERCPAVDVVLYGEGARTPAVVDFGGAAGAAAGTKGRYIGRLRLEGRKALSLELVPVPALPVGPEALERLALAATYEQEGQGFLERRFAYSEE
jgi:2',3'-cyclic-nucleotide 2'-phosphodiesterase (5'-nucleotidase family)